MSTCRASARRSRTTRRSRAASLPCGARVTFSPRRRIERGMRKLYVRIYFAVLASLAVFALCAGLLWRSFGEGGPWSQAYEVAATLAQNALPPAGAPKAEQQAALEKLAANLRADIALFAADRSLLAAVGAPLSGPDAGERGGWGP